MTMMRERILPTSSPEQLSVFKGHYADLMETTGNVKRWPLINGIVITEDPNETVPKENIGSYEWPASYAFSVMFLPVQAWPASKSPLSDMTGSKKKQESICVAANMIH